MLKSKNEREENLEHILLYECLLLYKIVITYRSLQRAVFNHLTGQLLYIVYLLCLTEREGEKDIRESMVIQEVLYIKECP